MRQTPNNHEDLALLNQLTKQCVRCGFCNATCPSYKMLGNELDGPRGRIYQIADLAAGHTKDAVMRDHLDSCLTCRNCETTCPSGVEYNKIIELGREMSLKTFKRSLFERLKRHLLVAFLSRSWFITRLLGAVSRVRGLLPMSLRQSIPKREKPLALLDTAHCTRKVVVLEGCVQPGLRPNTNRALHNLLARMGIAMQSLELPLCCGALPHHLEQLDKAKSFATAIIDAAERKFDQGCEKILMTSSACVLELKEYGWLLRNDPLNAEKAEGFVSKVVDPSELITQEAIANLGISTQSSVAFHPPCSLQHGQDSDRVAAVDGLLTAAGLRLTSVADRHLCCGSAGTYSIMQPKVATALRDEKITNLTAAQPDYIATANIGCQVFLQNGLPEGKQIWHWIELLENLANQADPKY